MLLLIKEQLKYIKHTNLISILFIHVATVIYAYLRDFSPLNLICFFLFTQYLSSVLINNAIENRDYTFNLLSIKRSKIALSRIILPYLGFILIYSVAIFIYITILNISSVFKDSIYELLTFGGIALFGIFLYLIIADYFSIIRSKSGFKWFNFSIGTAIALLAFIIIISVKKSFSYSLNSSILLISVTYVISIVLAYFSFLTYQKRESYLGIK